MSAALIENEIDFEAEAALDPAIRFAQPLSAHPLHPNAIFLTGATGFSGAYLLEGLLRKTKATVFCLVRADDPLRANERLINHLQSFGIWDEAFADRIRPVAGDLALPHLGLGERQFDDFAAQIDVIYHAAGWINMAFPYLRLKATNVNGTQEIVRLAGHRSTKPVHFLSSIAVFYSDAHSHAEILRETEIPRYHPSLKGGYSKSKWVADRVLANAQARGLPACIYRPVRIMGHSRTGAISDMGDILPQLLKGCILLGKYPDFDIEITLVTVDYVCDAMVHLAGREESWGRAFHLFNPSPIKWSRLISILRDLGYSLEEVSYDQWWQELTEHAHSNGSGASDDESVFATLRLALSAPNFLFYKRPPMDAANTQEGLHGSGIVCPAIDQSLIATYVAYWQKSGYLPRPSPVAATVV
jgi:thioester reductase-like protein